MKGTLPLGIGEIVYHQAPQQAMPSGLRVEELFTCLSFCWPASRVRPIFGTGTPVATLFRRLHGPGHYGQILD